MSVSRLVGVLLGLLAGLQGLAAEAGSGNRLLDLVGGRAVGQGLGINVHPGDSLGVQLDQAAALGFRLVRSDVLWSKVERERGRYDWRATDVLVGELRRRRLLPLLILAYSNPLYAGRWRGDEEGREDWAWMPPMSDEARAAFARFAAAAAARYGQRVIWEVWNEPNLTFGKPAQLDAYGRLAVAACQAMRAAQPEAVIVGPASNGFPLRFLKDFVAGDAANCFDAVSVHPYRDWEPDSALGDWRKLDGVLAKGDPSRRKVAIDSEWGYSVQGGPWTERRQAEYVTRLYLTDLMAGVPVTIIYGLRNDGRDAGEKEHNFGLHDHDGVAKPAADALARLVRDLGGFSLLGQVRAPSADLTLVAFGKTGGTIKLAAWSPSGRATAITVGPNLCIVPPGGEAGGCDAATASLQVAPATLTVDGLPAILELKAEGCRSRDADPVAFIEWCGRRRAAPAGAGAARGNDR